jgi:hypothetical protein
MIIVPEMVSSVVGVYNGKSFTEVLHRCDTNLKLLEDHCDKTRRHSNTSANLYASATTLDDTPTPVQTSMLFALLIRLHSLSLLLLSYSKICLNFVVVSLIRLFFLSRSRFF